MPFREVVQIPDLFEELDRSTSRFGAIHPRTVDIVNRLAIALWEEGDIRQVIDLLDQAIEATASGGFDHNVRCDLLCTLGRIMAEQTRWDRAATIYRELLQTCILRLGSDSARTLAAKGDLAAVLFELGEAAEAAELERDALESARDSLGRKHAATCVLAWNRAIRLENDGDGTAARAILDDLLWLLAAEDSTLETDHLAVKAMLSKRRGRATAAAC